MPHRKAEIGSGGGEFRLIRKAGPDHSIPISSDEAGMNLEEMIRLFRNGGITVMLAQVDSGLSKVFAELVRKYSLTLIPSFLDALRITIN
jgi:hypothetical protein